MLEKIVHAHLRKVSFQNSNDKIHSLSLVIQLYSRLAMHPLYNIIPITIYVLLFLFRKGKGMLRCVTDERIEPYLTWRASLSQKFSTVLTQIYNFW
jgi:hypothetical protein